MHSWLFNALGKWCKEGRREQWKRKYLPSVCCDDLKESQIRTEIKSTTLIWRARAEIYVPEWKSCERHLTRLKLRNPTDAPITWKALLEVMESEYEYAIRRVEWTVAYFKEDQIVSTRRLFMETAKVVNRAFRNPAYLETVLKKYQRLTEEIIRMM